MRTAAVVVTWEGGAATERCVASLLAQDRPARRGDRGRQRLERGRARRGCAAGFGARDARPPPAPRRQPPVRRRPQRRRSRGDRTRARERLLLLNNDTVLAPDALGLLRGRARGGARRRHRRSARRRPAAPDHVLSAGERHSLPLLCVPAHAGCATGGRAAAPYAVSGVMGCALLVTRACFEAVGGFSEEIAVYYEDVDFCLAARARGFGAVVEPRAVVQHDGLRGFASGLTPWAAYLKARNPWLVVRRHGGAAGAARLRPGLRRHGREQRCALCVARPRATSCARSAGARSPVAGRRRRPARAGGGAARRGAERAHRHRRAGRHRRRAGDLRPRAGRGPGAPRRPRLRRVHRSPRRTSPPSTSSASTCR